MVVLSHSEATGKDTGKDMSCMGACVAIPRGKVTEVQALTDTALAADAGEAQSGRLRAVPARYCGAMSQENVEVVRDLSHR